MIDDEFKHKPVLINEVIESIEPADDKIYFDATFGNGGYSKKILSSSNCKVIAIDRDPSVSSKAQEFEEKYGHKCPIGVNGRNSDNALYEEKIGWVVSEPLQRGMERTYSWIKQQVDKTNG